MMNKARGRPRGGDSGARERILAAARASFLERGYRATTMRALAAQAQVDPALISYHFRSKQGLFGAAMALNRSPAQVLRAALAGPPQTLPERLATAIVDIWDDPVHGRPLVAMVAAAFEHDAAMRAFQEYIEHEVVGRLAEYLGGARAATRANAAIAVVVGAIFTRYVLRLRPSATMPAAEFTRSLVPPLAAALELPRPAAVAPAPPGRNVARRATPRRA
jgi:AcrR family transcriptional regulator